jgi:rubrerythrin
MARKKPFPTGGLSTEMAYDLNLRPEGKLISALGTHRERESTALDCYQRLVTQCGDEGIRYLGTLILEDEERHHDMIDEMLNSVRSFEEDLDIEPSVPSSVSQVSDDLLTETERLLDFEKADLAELRHLKKDFEDEAFYPLLQLLVKLIIRDTRKHIDILKFIRSSAHA